MERREVASRGNPLIRRAAAWLAGTRVTPNQISVSSAAFSLLVPAGLLLVPSAAGALLALAGVQLRLLANVLDGLVAVEGGKSSPLGALYNEMPDRVADSIILVAVGYAAGTPGLGWACALLAALTAYVRVFGGSLGQPQVFTGPMAKQHRMAVVSVALVAAALLPAAAWSCTFWLALCVIAVGSMWTCARRTMDIARSLRGAA